jgi:hypothetical protein
MPAHVGDDPVAAEWWTRLVDAMAPGTFSAADESVLADFAIGMSFKLDAISTLASEGFGGPRGGKSPAAHQLAMGNGMVNAAIDRLGLSRAERQRLGEPRGSGGDPRNSKFGDLLGKPHA